MAQSRENFASSKIITGWLAVRFKRALASFSAEFLRGYGLILPSFMAFDMLKSIPGKLMKSPCFSSGLSLIKPKIVIRNHAESRFGRCPSRVGREANVQRTESYGD
jgi:hypothetical protein